MVVMPNHVSGYDHARINRCSGQSVLESAISNPVLGLPDYLGGQRLSGIDRLHNPELPFGHDPDLLGGRFTFRLCNGLDFDPAFTGGDPEEHSRLQPSFAPNFLGNHKVAGLIHGSNSRALHVTKPTTALDGTQERALHNPFLC